MAALACGASASAAAAEPSVVAQWRFDESAGQALLDDGPFGLHAMLGTSPDADGQDPARVAGASGGALHFDGHTIVRLPDSDALELQSLSAEAVVRAPSSPGSFRYVISRGGRQCWSGSYGLYTAADGGMALYVFDGQRYVISAAARAADVWDGAWHYVAGTYDGQALRLYLDGRPVGSPMAVALQLDYTSTSDHAYLGQYAGDCDLAYAGDLDLVRLSSGALSADAIGRTARALASPGAPTTSAPTVFAPLAPAAPGTIIKAATPAGDPSTAPGGSPTASAPSCRIVLSRTRVRAGHRTVVGARVLSRASGGALKLSVRRTTGGKALTTARVAASGRAKLVIGAARKGRLTVRVAGHPACATAGLTIA